MSCVDRILPPSANGVADEFAQVPNDETTTCHNVATPKSFCRFQDSIKPEDNDNRRISAMKFGPASTADEIDEPKAIRR
jgi:hypothetical protein